MPRMSYTTHNAAPDSENILKTDLTPAAQPIRNFKGPVALQIPDAPQDNSLSQLGSALSRFNPALNAVAEQVVDSRTKEEIAAAHEASRKAQAENVQNLKEAQSKNLIPDGASPNYIRAWKGNFLKLNAERGRQLMQEAYYANDELRNSDDPDAFTKFAQEWKSKYDTTNNVVDGYTPLEIHDSRYHETLSGVAEDLHGQQIRYRVGEREKAAINTASDLVMSRLDFHLDHAVDAPDLNEVAAAINDVFTNPTTGMMSYGGMKGSKANEVLTEAIITKAMSDGDASILDVADHITAGSAGSPNATLARTKVFREKAEVARQHIANSTWLSSERQRQMAQYKGSGVSTPEMVEQRAREDRARIEADYQEHSQQLADKQQERGKRSAADPEMRAIAKLHALDGDYASPEIQQHLKALAEIDPESYRTMTTFLQTQARRSSEPNAAVSLQAYTKLRAELSSDPSKFNPKSIIEAANANHITAGQVSSLYDDYEKSLKTRRENPSLSTPLVNQLRSDLRASSMKSDADEYGSGRLAADKATAEFNALLEGYVRSHKGATEYEVYEAMEKHIEKIARKYNKDLDQNLAGQERHEADKKSKQVEQEQMQERVSKEVEQLRSQPQQDGERAKLDAQLKSKYPNTQQRAEIINQLLRKKGK